MADDRLLDLPQLRPHCFLAPQEREGRRVVAKEQQPLAGPECGESFSNLA